MKAITSFSIILDIHPEFRLCQLQLFPILNILVPHVGHTPCVAGFPFFIVIDLESFISFLARHFTQ